MRITYGKGFDVAPAVSMIDKVEALQTELLKLPQYEPITKHTFHGGMYCREVFREAGILIVGKVHKKEHFYFVAGGTVAITTDEGVQFVTGPHLLCSKPGTKRAVYAETDALCMTFHCVKSTNVEDAEAELVEDAPESMFGVGNQIKVKELT